MGGTWKPNPLPVRAGSYTVVESTGNAPVAPGSFGVVGIPVRASWGPENEFVDITSDIDRIAAFGAVDGDPTDATNTSWLIREIIQGGAARVKARRVVGTGAANAYVTVPDGDGDVIVTLTAKYQGVRGNALRVRIIQNLLFSYKNDLVVEELVGASYVEVERWTYDADDVTRLVDALNGGSLYVTAALNTSQLAPVNEVQVLSNTAAVTGGNFRLQFFDGTVSRTTADIPYTAEDADIQAALEGLSNIGGGNVTVTLDDNGPTFQDVNTIMLVEFVGDLAGANQAQLTVVGALGVPLAGGTIEITTSIEGSAFANEIQSITATTGFSGSGIQNEEQEVTTGGASSGTFTLEFNAAVTDPIAYDATATEVKQALEALSTVGLGNVIVSGTDPWTVEFVNDLAATNVAQLNINGAGLTGGSPDTSTNVEGTNGKWTITFNDGSGALETDGLDPDATPAQVQAALEALGNVGTGNVVVSGDPAGDTLADTGTVYTIAFKGTLTGQDLVPITVDLTHLEAGAASISEVTKGQPDALAINTTGLYLGGGSDGATLTLSDYTDVLTAFEAEGDFDIFVLDGISEEDFSGLNAAMKSWVVTNNDAGRYIMAVIGGGDTELANVGNTGVQTALQRSVTMDSEFIVNLGVAGLKVETPAGVVLSLNSCQSAPRLAGMIAAAGVTGAVTFNDTGAVGLNGGVSPALIEQLIQNGVMTFGKRSGNRILVEDGVTSFVSVTEEKGFSFTQIRAARAMQKIGADVNDLIEQNWIGKKINSASVRDQITTQLGTYFVDLEGQGVLVPGTKVSLDARFDNTKTNVFILVEAQFAYELKRVLLTIRVPAA